MTSQIKINCDLCNKELKENEIKKSDGVLGFGSKPQSKYNLQFTDDGTVKKGDLCFSCGIKFRDYIDNMKQRKK